MSAVHYFLHDAEGNIVSAGQCQAEVLSLMEQPGMTLCEGVADPVANYYDIHAGRVLAYDEAALARREARQGIGYRWSLGQWIDERSLAQAKAQKWLEIKQARSTAEFGTFIVGGYELDCDRESQVRINSAFQAAMDARTNGEPFSISWTLANDTNVTLARAQVIAVGRALQAHVSAQYDKARLLREQILAATTKEQLEAVSW